MEDLSALFNLENKLFTPKNVFLNSILRGRKDKDLMGPQTSIVMVNIFL